MGFRTGAVQKRKFIEALNETLKAEFRLNPDTFMWGQDMASGEKGGVFNVSKGMQKEFGLKRVFNAPIAEDYIVGTANGMSRFKEKIRIVIEGAELPITSGQLWNSLWKCRMTTGAAMVSSLPALP